MNWFVSAVCRIGSSLPYLTQQLAIELEIRHIGKDADVSQKRGWIRSESAREARITQSAGCGWWSNLRTFSNTDQDIRSDTRKRSQSHCRPLRNYWCFRRFQRTAAAFRAIALRLSLDRLAPCRLSMHRARIAPAHADSCPLRALGARLWRVPRPQVRSWLKSARLPPLGVLCSGGHEFGMTGESHYATGGSTMADLELSLDDITRLARVGQDEDI